MKTDDLQKMQQNLQQMKHNLENMYRIEPEETTDYQDKSKGRHVAQKERNQIRHSTIAKIAREERIIVLITIAIVAFTCIFSTSIFAKTISENQVANTNTKNETQEKQNVEENQPEQTKDTPPILEKNENAIQLEEILLENVSVLKSKEYAEEQRPIPFEITYNENPNLPEGEEAVNKQGIEGKQQVKVIKSYENDVLVGEDILETIIIENPAPQIVDKGTSKFLSNNQVHLGDTMYVTQEVKLMDKANHSANEIKSILKSLDVTLKELQGESWCKVEYDGIEGYIESKNLTSSKVAPQILEANRVQKIKMTLQEDMPLNQSTNLTLEDYEKILSGNSADKNHIIEQNAEVFYHMDKEYQLNGVFLAAMAIHESGWATSTISKDKKNLFGYGAYDNSPYESSFSFETYAEGIELLAKVLVKYYINQAGTPIYENETAKGSYYNGSTISGVNVRYASDTQWHEKVYKYMKYLYERL